MNIENGTLTVNGQSIELPAIQADARVRVWAVPLDYRENGLFVAVFLPGQPDEIPACSLADTEYLGELEYPAAESHKLEAAKAAKLVELNAGCERALSILTASYPPGELQSWPQQVKEADDLAANPQAETPLLSAIATARGLTVVEMVERVRLKADAYAQLSGSAIGRRQALEDLLELAETVEQVEAIAW
ncbi:hypothetical protein [Pseudomonas putida]|uniref:hypothetical protein n=1 Tax=Pseudomonas putida TaxID=303 RepID=UPI0035A47AEE